MSLDTLSNMVSTIKNAYLARKEFVEIPYTKMCEDTAKLLKQNSFLEDVKVFKEKDSTHKGLRLVLSYKDGTPVLTDIKRVSKPGRRIYSGARDLKSVSGGYGVSIVSTSRGLVTNLEARKKKLGGEVILKVW